MHGTWRDQARLILLNNWEATYFDFDEETAPINNPIGYGLQILENWHNMGVKTLEEAKKYNKLNKNRSEMIVVDKKGGTL